MDTDHPDPGQHERTSDHELGVASVIQQLRPQKHTKQWREDHGLPLGCSCPRERPLQCRRAQRHHQHRTGLCLRAMTTLASTSRRY